MITELFIYSIMMLVIGLVCGLVPVFSPISRNPGQLKLWAGLASGILIATAFLIAIPNGYDIANDSDDKQIVIGQIAVLTLEVEQGKVSASQAIEEISDIIENYEGKNDEQSDDTNEEEHNHDHGDHSHDNSPFDEKIIHEIWLGESGEKTPENAISEIRIIVSQEGDIDAPVKLKSFAYGLMILVGFTMMLIIDALRVWKLDVGDDSDIKTNQFTGWMLLAALSLHAAIDGVVIGLSATLDSLTLSSGIVLLILIQRGPIALSLGFHSLVNRKTRKESFRDVAIYSTATPLMIYITYFILEDISNILVGLGMLISAGCILYVTLINTFSNVKNVESDKRLMAYVAVGILLVSSLFFISDAVELF